MKPDRIIQGMEFHRKDCMEVMRQTPDKFYDLCICDPPYGIGASSVSFKNGSSKHPKPYFRETCWDEKPPTKEYFDEIKRVSENQIVWGGNYFSENLGSSRGFIVWDKTIHGNSYADCEFAWTSLDRVARMFVMNIVNVTTDGRIHPTQKPVALYSWLLSNYAKPGMKILDTHLGSGSIAIACYNHKMSLVGCELDQDYFDAAMSRIERETAQMLMM